MTEERVHTSERDWVASFVPEATATQRLALVFTTIESPVSHTARIPRGQPAYLFRSQGTSKVLAMFESISQRNPASPPTASCSLLYSSILPCTPTYIKLSFPLPIPVNSTTDLCHQSSYRTLGSLLSIPYSCRTASVPILPPCHPATNIANPSLFPTLALSSPLPSQRFVSGLQQLPHTQVLLCLIRAHLFQPGLAEVVVEYAPRTRKKLVRLYMRGNWK